MNKKKEIPQTIEIGQKDKFLQFYFLNQRKVHGYVVGLLVAIIASIVYFTSGPGIKESVEAREAFDQWKKSPSDPLFLKKMRQILKKFPEYEKSVQAEVVQVFLTNDQVDEAMPMATLCIERLRRDAPLHASFAETSLMIENKQYQKALETSVALKEEMERSLEIGRLKEKATEVGSALYAWNLLRIAFLQKELCNQPGELSAWEDVKALLQEKGVSAGKFLEVNFAQKNFSLADFISLRERSISE